MGYKIKRALLSVSDKSGIVEFAGGLEKLGVEMLSTGGTEKLLRESGIKVQTVSDYTGFPEMLDGRVKTLHPKIHAGLLARRDKSEHIDALEKNDIQTIDLVVVNLYPFRETVAKSGVSLEDAVENIDIGGPTMLRSAAKNYEAVVVIVSPGNYKKVLGELEQNACELSQETRRSLMLDVFKLTSVYDTAIHSYLNSEFSQTSPDGFAENLTYSYEKVQGLRYGENPHQPAAFYRESGRCGLADMVKLQGKELSYNNLIDLDTALEIRDFTGKPAAIIIKHTNPCGLAEAETLVQAYRDALSCDELSAFGSVVGLNREVDKETAEAIHSASFVEAVLAPDFTSEAKDILSDKKNMRLLSLDDIVGEREIAKRYIKGGVLLQEKDAENSLEEKYTTATKREPTDDELNELRFAWQVARLVKSNAIVLAKGSKTVGIGAGQMSRVDSVIIAIRKAGERASNSVLASDAFFPFPDAIEEAHRAGIKAIIQPGGAKRDNEIIEAANACNIAMVFTGRRHFRH